MTLTYWDIESGELKHRATGGAVTLRHDRLLKELPEDAMPSRARGDKKERTFNLLIRDGVDPRESIKEEKLIGKTSTDEDRGFSTATAIAGTHHAVLGEVLDDHYVVGGEGKGSVRFLFPFHSFLPGTFSFYGQYKMFTGKVL